LSTRQSWGMQSGYSCGSSRGPQMTEMEKARFLAAFRSMMLALRENLGAQ
jgi:hypothetical protein